MQAKRLLNRRTAWRCCLGAAGGAALAALAGEFPAPPARPQPALAQAATVDAPKLTAWPQDEPFDLPAPIFSEPYGAAPIAGVRTAAEQRPVESRPARAAVPTPAPAPPPELVRSVLLPYAQERHQPKLDLVEGPAEPRMAMASVLKRAPSARTAHAGPSPSRPTPGAASESEAWPSSAWPQAWDDEVARLAASASVDELGFYTPSAATISQQTLTDIRAAFALGRSGALFAASDLFVGVLRKIAESKDAAGGTDEHSRALAEGLRAIEEAEGFASRAGSIDVESLAASHETPVLAKAVESGERLLPHEAIARYHRYAELKLGAAVAGEPAGSMAMFGLGKTFARLAELGDDEQATRKAITMHRAALQAHPENHLAANELGVVLAKNGHYSDALAAIEQALRLMPTATAYHNLAFVERKLGHPDLSAAAEEAFARLSAQEKESGAYARSRGVQWMPPGEFARSDGDTAPRPATQAPGTQQANSAAVRRGDAERTGEPAPRAEGLGRVWDMAQQLTSGKPLAPASPANAAHAVASPLPPPFQPAPRPTAPPVPSRTVIR